MRQSNEMKRKKVSQCKQKKHHMSQCDNCLHFNLMTQQQQPEGPEVGEETKPRREERRRGENRSIWSKGRNKMKAR